MSKLKVLFIGGTGVISSACAREAVGGDHGAREIADWYLADPSRQAVDPQLDALMDKLAAEFGVAAP